LLRDDPTRAKFCSFVERLGHVYREGPEFWRRDNEWEGFSWISADDGENSVLSYVRRDGERHAIVVLNLTPVPRDNYRIGAPGMTTYREILNSDASEWGGSGNSTRVRVTAQPSPFHGFPQSIELSLPPLSILVLTPEQGA
jgi:1,4-alpha-glucan branching enzyme